MQRLTGGPRGEAGLTEAQVKAILHGPIQGRGGCERLDQSLVLQEDVSDRLLRGSVGRVMNATIHGTCALSFDQQMDWNSLYRPYTELWDPGNPSVVTRWYRGVYSLNSPEDTATSEAVLTTGADRVYFLDRLIADSYGFAKNTNVLGAVAQTFADAGVSGFYLDTTTAAKTLPKAMSWPLLADTGRFTTWLTVVNQLLASIGYRGVWVDETGLFRSEPYLTPLQRPIEYTFDATADNRIVGKRRVRKQELWGRPNYWKFIQQNRDEGQGPPVDGDGIAEYTNQSGGPTSVDVVGRVFPRIEKVDVVDQAALVSRVAEAANADMRIATYYSVSTGPFPAAWHQDVFSYKDKWGTVRVQASRWSGDIAVGEVEWTWEQVA